MLRKRIKLKQPSSPRKQSLSPIQWQFVLLVKVSRQFLCSIKYNFLKKPFLSFFLNLKRRYILDSMVKIVEVYLVSFCYDQQGTNWTVFKPNSNGQQTPLNCSDCSMASQHKNPGQFPTFYITQFSLLRYRDIMQPKWKVLRLGIGSGFRLYLSSQPCGLRHVT